MTGKKEANIIIKSWSPSSEIGPIYFPFSFVYGTQWISLLLLTKKNVDECFFIGVLEIWLQQCKCLSLHLQSIAFLSSGKAGPHDTSLPGQSIEGYNCEYFVLIIPAAESSRVPCHDWKTTLQYMSPLPQALLLDPLRMSFLSQKKLCLH